MMATMVARKTERDLRRALVSVLATRRKTTMRAARVLVQRRLGRGMSFEDAAWQLLRPLTGL